MLLTTKIKKSLGHALWKERQKRYLPQSFFDQKLNLSTKLLDYVEIGTKSVGWTHYEKLLKFYGKEIKIELIDKE